jgi:hypothetical protein
MSFFRIACYTLAFAVWLVWFMPMTFEAADSLIGRLTTSEPKGCFAIQQTRLLGIGWGPAFCAEWHQCDDTHLCHDHSPEQIPL